MASSGQWHKTRKGPSREALFDALRLVSERRRIRCEYQIGSTWHETEMEVELIKAILDDVHHEGHAWRVTGYRILRKDEVSGVRFVWLYYTDKRTGRMLFRKPR